MDSFKDLSTDCQADIVKNTMLCGAGGALVIGLSSKKPGAALFGGVSAGLLCGGATYMFGKKCDQFNKALDAATSED